MNSIEILIKSIGLFFANSRLPVIYLLIFVLVSAVFAGNANAFDCHTSSEKVVTHTFKDIDIRDQVSKSELGVDEHGNRVVRTILTIRFCKTATSDQVSSLLSTIDAKIVNSKKGRFDVLVRVPDPGSVSDLDDLRIRISRKSFVKIAERYYMGGGRGPLQENETFEWQGTRGRIGEPSIIVIKDWNTFEKLYRTCFGRDYQIGLVFPTIDFSREMVVAVFLGYQGTGLINVNILQAKEAFLSEFKAGHFGKSEKSITDLDVKAFVVEYEVKKPVPGSLVPMVITRPFHMKVVKKSDLPVVFINRQSASGMLISRNMNSNDTHEVLGSLKRHAELKQID